jgi:phosphohistidine phosphatase
MEIYILRHGIAENTQPDAERALTAEGREKLKRVLQRVRAEPGVILSSPLRRAVETAEALLPDASPHDAWQEVRSRSGEQAILLASHEPLTGALAAFLLGCPGLNVEMKKAALVRMDCERFGPQPKCVLKWMLTPAVA